MSEHVHDWRFRGPAKASGRLSVGERRSCACGKSRIVRIPAGSVVRRMTAELLEKARTSA